MGCDISFANPVALLLEESSEWQWVATQGQLPLYESHDDPLGNGEIMGGGAVAGGQLHAK